MRYAARSMANPTQNRLRLVPRDGSNRLTGVIMRGGRRRLLNDVYYLMLQASWARLVVFIFGTYVVVNILFAVVYVVAGGVEGARPGEITDAFYFSVQTMATIGYGVMHPTTHLANVLVTVEAILGLLFFAMATGVLFAKFARPIGQLVFSNVAVVMPREGKPVMMFRVGNERRNHVVEATVKVSVVRDETTLEGERVRRWYELPLVRNTSPVFALTWSVMHVIDEQSKLFGATHESMQADRTEIVVTMIGLDSTLSANIHARHSYTYDEIIYDARFVDILSIDDDGQRIIDFSRFHDVEPLKT
jgi:inward rectifier potassium channel